MNRYYLRGPNEIREVGAAMLLALKMEEEGHKPRNVSDL